MAKELGTNNTNTQSLDPRLQEIALKILKEYSDTGYSNTMNELKYDDYKEIPVDIETFLTDDQYLGIPWKDARGKSKVYPFWMKTLKKLFPSNLDTAYNTLLESGARGLGKSEVACGAVGAYLMYRIMCMKNPLEFYNLKPTEKIVFAFMNIKLDLAEEIAVSKFQKTIQLSPWFMARGTMIRRNNADYWKPPEPISIVIGSQADDVIGKPVYFAFFDEISFIKNLDVDIQKKRAQNMIDTAIGGMLTRFVHNGINPTMLVVASSKRSEQSFMESYIKSLSETDGSNTFVVDEPVWKVKPAGTYSTDTFKVAVGDRLHENLLIPLQDYNNLEFYRLKGYTNILEVPVDFKAKFLQDIDRALCDYAGISSSSLNKFMSAQRVVDCIDDKYENPFPDIIEVGNGRDDLVQYKNFFKVENVPKQYMNMPLYVHLDMSKTGDMTGIAGVWIIGKKPTTDGSPSNDLSFQLAFNTSVKAPKGREISFEKNRNFVRWLREVGFNVKEVTADSYQSVDLIQILNSEDFVCNTLSVDIIDAKSHICLPYQYLKSTVYEQRFKMYKTKRLYDEFVELERDMNSGKIDHPRNGHKDALDAVCGATFTASKHAEEFAYDYGEALDTIIENNSDNTRTQVTIDLEKELIGLLESKAKPRTQQTQSKAVDKKQEDDSRFIDFGLGKAQKVSKAYMSQGIAYWGD